MPVIDPKSARAEAKAAKARAKALRPWYRKKRWWVLGLVVLIAGIAVAISAGSKSTVTMTPYKAPAGTNATPPSASVAAGAVLLTQSGSGTASTVTFTAPTNWDLAWTYDCSSVFGAKGSLTVFVEQNPNSGTMAAMEDASVIQLGTGGAGTQHYHYGGGGVYFSVFSECTWTIKATAA
jgi:hypothetical protein